MKKILQSAFFTNIIYPVMRGTIKPIPLIGTPFVELMTNLIALINHNPDDLNPTKIIFKHKWLSILIQISIAFYIFYALYIGQISINEILSLSGINK